jgi:long-chain acyl-CoA synthetase
MNTTTINNPDFWQKNYPEGVSYEIEIEKITLPAILKRTSLTVPERTAMVFLEQKIDYKTLAEWVNRFANSLTNLGVKKGDRVALMLPNMPQFIVANYALLQIGAVGAMVNPLYTERELEHLLNDSGSETLIIWDMLFGKAQSVWSNTSLKRVVLTHVNDLVPIPSAMLPAGYYAEIQSQENVFEFKEILDEASTEPAQDVSNWDDLAILIYTGGTTGISKGVMLNHSNLSSTVQQTVAYFSNVFEKGTEIVPVIYPMFHVAGYSVVQNVAVWNGSTMLLVPRPEVKSLAEMIKKYKPTVFQAVPTLFVGLLNEPTFREADMAQVKIFGTGAAPMSGATYNALKELVPHSLVNEGYGMTETSGLISSTPGVAKFKQGSVGLPMPNTEVKIVDVETGEQEMPIGKEGELILKGPQVMQGYYNRPEATDDTFKEGWLYTGDIAYIDEEGWIFIVDRKKDIIIASGYNVYPKEIDEVLFLHPHILEACTIGVQDEYRGETVKAFIVAKEGLNIDKEEIISFCREKLAPYKVPRLIEFVDELPKSAVGKILRRKLRDA